MRRTRQSHELMLVWSWFRLGVASIVVCGIAALLMVTGVSIRADEQEASPDKKQEAQSTAAADPDKEQVKLICRVVDAETDQGLPDVKVEILVLMRPMPGQSPKDFMPQHRINRTTDANGNYDFTVSRELLEKPDVMINVKAEYPGYIPSSQGIIRRGSGLRRMPEEGLPPINDKITLRKGEEITGTVTGPNGQPLAGVACEAHSMITVENRRSVSATAATTNQQGRFLVTVPKGGETQISILPRNFAFGKKHVGKNRGDVGEIQLEEGVRVSGVLLDVDRKPVVGVPVNIAMPPARDLDNFPMSRSFRRGGITDSEGKFSFSPLSPGEYQLTVDDRIQDSLQFDNRKVTAASAIFARKTVVVVKDAENAPIEFQAIPYIVIRVQFYNSENVKVKGENLSILGTIDGQPWSTRPTVDSNGTHEIKVPHGLEKAELRINSNPGTAFRYRRGSGEIVRGGGFMRNSLDTLTDDESLDVFLYTAPKLSVAVVNEQGDEISQLKLRATDAPSQRAKAGEADDSQSAVVIVRSSSGQFQSANLLPDEEVTVMISAPGYVSAKEVVNLKEGETKNLKVTLKKE